VLFQAGQKSERSSVPERQSRRLAHSLTGTGLESKRFSARANVWLAVDVPCVFCGNSRLTREHVWPRWLARAAPAPRPRVLLIRRRTNHLWEGQRTENQWSAPAYTIRVRAVCAACNNGWMSDLEQEVRPLLEPMLHGETRILDGERQGLLARWAFKTTVMLEFTHPQERAIQPADTSWLYEQREPPQNAMIWIASYRGVARNSFYRHDVMQPHTARPESGAPLPPDRVVREHDAPLEPQSHTASTLAFVTLHFSCSERRGRTTGSVTSDWPPRSSSSYGHCGRHLRGRLQRRLTTALCCESSRSSPRRASDEHAPPLRADDAALAQHLMHDCRASARKRRPVRHTSSRFSRSAAPRTEWTAPPLRFQSRSRARRLACGLARTP
jgi:hypothetical protein